MVDGRASSFFVVTEAVTVAQVVIVMMGMTLVVVDIVLVMVLVR